MTDVEILRGGRIKAGDTHPDLRVKLMEDEYPFNLTGYTVDVKLKRTDADTATVDASATIDVANRGIVTYSWQTGDTDNSGTYLLEFVADDGAGETVTFPNLNYAKVYIEDRL